MFNMSKVSHHLSMHLLYCLVQACVIYDLYSKLYENVQQYLLVQHTHACTSLDFRYSGGMDEMAVG